VIRWRKAIAAITLAPFLTCSGCLPSGWLPGARSPADGPKTTDADTAAEGPVITEGRPEPIPLATGPIPSAEAPDAAASGARSASPAARAAEVPGSGGNDAAQKGSYRIGEDDELEISVYGDDDLKKTQAVRPDGKIAFPLIGDVQAAGLTPDELRSSIAQGVAQYFKNPRVTVIVKKYDSKRVSVLGEVKTPGLLRLSSDITLVEAISRVEGVTSSADLQGALLVRAGRILPVNFDKLLRLGDVSQNVVLAANDIVLIPDVKDRKVFVLGEVKKPIVLPLKPGSTVVEAIANAGGFTADAQPKSVVVVRGGLGAPRPLTVDVLGVTEGKTTDNLVLGPGDIVYVPRSFVADAMKFFQNMATVLTPLVMAATGIVLGGSAQAVLTGAAVSTPVGASVSVTPPP
jgi:polysaccharide biosynthesis/export protein